ncbi:SMP-30/gluconolactonase/LRE family protein [Lysinibacillus sp. BW-2-10]|uniref:SMP-30/gluconolactonase/LRE family protein n=1 Tax=Lysinibacillus sp. BW-2-10 TaxID=2590030 RepID=UPI001642CF50|nr:SMP-30/gluconolactonase/LRE family protein [Lysinibacillus sp. BW-2-10]
MNIKICGQYRSLFGEGPIWHDQFGLLWLDITQQKIISYNEETNVEKVYDAKGRIKSIIPTKKGDLVAVYKDGLYSFDLGKETKTFLCAPSGLNNLHYLNDAKCGFEGSIWVGSSDGGFKEFKENSETARLPYLKRNSFLYRIDEQLNIHIVKDQITISNGLDWNRHNQKFYYIDSAKQAIFEYEIDNDKNLQNEQLIYQFDVIEGFPDGMTIDVDGNLWVAIFKSGVIAMDSDNTSKILHINPHTRSILNEIKLPVPHVTSCTIGGNQLDTLFITTALEPIPNEKRSETPYAGHLLRVKIPTKGVKPYYFSSEKLVEK